MKKLDKLMDYLSTGINVTDNDVIVVVDDAHASERLRSASGRQIVISYPEMETEGDSSDHSLPSYSVVVYVLELMTTVLRTPKSELSQYRGLLSSVKDIVDSIRSATTDVEDSRGLIGMQLKSTSIMPVYKTYGNWGGWIIELNFK